MSDLSPRAQQLISRASKGGGPTEAQRKAVKRGAMAVAVASTLAAAATTKFLIIGLALGAAGGGLAVAVLSKSPAKVVAVPPPPAALEPAPSADDVKPEPQVETPPPEPRPIELPPIQPAKSEAAPSLRRNDPSPEAPLQISTLARELAALDVAVRAIDAGKFEEGLGDARDFLRAFPDSELAIEAQVVEVLALCGLSRFDEAQSIVSNFSVESRNNPAVRRLSNSCVELSP